ncbi:uncharacterized protein LOC122041838 [Zingiber officinale]|uniref:uncharacterized protein LOC122041838 n=1 Tax=Zingiber officinale TaxID=94328 RepID=UPI001C4C2E24|nr:uncharacterized protein LOC122041838 [Zingiber officinale]
MPITYYGRYIEDPAEDTWAAAHWQERFYWLNTFGQPSKRMPPGWSTKVPVVAVDYFSKWVEAEPLQALTSVAYPQSNEQTKVANHEILRILHARLDHVGGSWVDKLPSVLWGICMTPKEGTGVTPFHLVYGGQTVVPVEVRVESDRIQHYSEDNTDQRLLELDLVGEARTKAASRLMAYRQRVKQSYNQRVIPRSFQVGDLVWKKVKPIDDVTKLEAPWVRPFKVVEKLRSSTYYLEDEHR